MRARWLSGRAIGLHVGVLLMVPGCGLAAWWQITRASDGNGLSYLYAIEWPIFAVLGVYFWWMLIHTDYDAVGLRGMRNRAQEAVRPPTTVSEPMNDRTPPPAGHDDPELAAYNARLSALSASGAKTWRTREHTVVRRHQPS